MKVFLILIIPRSGILGFLALFAASFFPFSSQASQTSDGLLAQIGDPVQIQSCQDVPLLEWPKFRTECGFEYLRALPLYLEAREALRRERLEIEKSRAWVWFVAPPTAGNCADIPELEKEKFAYQCAPKRDNNDLVGLFEWDLARLKDQRDALAARVEIVRKDYDRLRSRQDTFGRSSPEIAAQLEGLREVLDRLDAVALRGDVMRRFVMELERNRAFDLGQVARIALDEAPAALSLTADPDPTSEPVGQTNGSGDIVIVIETVEPDPETIMLVHAGYGLVYADKSDFYAR